MGIDKIEVVVVCSRDGHPEAKVCRFVRHDRSTRRPGSSDVLNSSSVWIIAAVTGIRNDQMVQTELMEGAPNRQKLRARCTLCGLDVQRQRPVFGEVLDKLVEHGVSRIELAALAARLH